jgi:hypothetical protein
MTVYAIQEELSGKPHQDTLWYAAQAVSYQNWFMDENHTVMKVRNPTSHSHFAKGVNPKFIYLGSISFMTSVFEAQAIRVKSFGIIAPLRPYYAREIWRTTLESLMQRENWDLPLFAKPHRLKEFYPGVCQRPSDIPFNSIEGDKPLASDTPVICSSVVDFVSEYRFFIHRNKVVGCQPYTPRLVQDTTSRYDPS